MRDDRRQICPVQLLFLISVAEELILHLPLSFLSGAGSISQSVSVERQYWVRAITLPLCPLMVVTGC